MKKKINGYLLAGLIITGIILIAILVGAFWTPYSPTAMKYGRFQPPSFSHLFGTDNFGRDIFSRVLKGAGTTFSIALSTVAIGALAGTVIGAVTGYFGGLADDILMRMNDALTAFPSFLLALLVVSLVGPGNKYSVVIALGLVFIPSFARVMRTEYASLRNQNYVTGARLMGVGSIRLLSVHLLPNTVRVLLPAVTIGFNNAVLAEAGMSYLGIGVQPPDASLGSMLSEAQTFLYNAPGMAVFPGVVMIFMILGFNLLADGLQRK